MSGTVAAFAEICVRTAARRWPAAIRDGMAAEWRAELVVLRHDPRLGRGARTWRQLAFAVSLACSPAVGKEDPMTLTWRDRVPALGFAVGRIAVYTGIAFAAELLPRATADLWYQISTQNKYLPVPRGEDIAGTLAAMVLALVAMALLGVAAARLAPRPGGRPLAVAAFVTVPLGLAGYVVYYAGGRYQVHAVLNTGPPPAALLGFAVWTVVATAALAGALRLAASGRRVAATGAGIVGLLLAVDVAGWVTALPSAASAHANPATGPLWSPLALLPLDAVTFGPITLTVGPDTFHASTVVAGLAGLVAVPALMCAAFAATYLLRGRAVRLTVAEAPAAERGKPRPALASRAVRGYAYATGVVALGAWAGTLARVGPLDLVNYPRDFHGILPSTAFTAILLAVLAFVVANAGRGPVAAPAVGIFAVLATADRLVTAAQPEYGSIVQGPPAGGAFAAGLFVLGAAALGGATWLTGRLAGQGTTPTSARRALAGVVVIATFSVPAAVTFDDLFRHRQATIPAGGGEISDIPPVWLAALAVAVAVLLVATAFVAALAARTRPLPRVAVAGMALLVVAVAAVPVTPTGDALRTALYWPFPQFFAQPVLAVVLLAVLAWRHPTRPVLAAGAWTLAAVVAAAVTVPLHEPVRDVGDLVAGLLLPYRAA